MRVFSIILLYIVIINFSGFLTMYIDKQKARKRAFRIPESTLFTLAIMGGSIGCIIGMHLFRHKTRHWYFLLGMPLILVLQIIGIFLLFFSPVEITLL